MKFTRRVGDLSLTYEAKSTGQVIELINAITDNDKVNKENEKKQE